MFFDTSKLSPRQTQVIELAAQGLTDNEIARELEIASNTVKDHWEGIRSLFETLGFKARGRAGVVHEYYKAQINKNQRELDERQKVLRAERTRTADLTSELEGHQRALEDLSSSASEKAAERIIQLNAELSQLQARNDYLERLSELAGGNRRRRLLWRREG